MDEVEIGCRVDVSEIKDQKHSGRKDERPDEAVVALCTVSHRLDLPRVMLILDGKRDDP